MRWWRQAKCLPGHQASAAVPGRAAPGVSARTAWSEGTGAEFVFFALGCFWMVALVLLL